MKKYDILRYGLMKRFKGGVKISMTLTYRCNLKCPYCSILIPTGKIPNVEETRLGKLKRFVKMFPYKIKEVKITGGAPELHPDFVEFVNWLLERGYFVQVFTNLLFYDKLNGLIPTYRLLIIATYHHSSDKHLWAKNYALLKQKYRIMTDEIGNQKLEFSRVKPCLTEEDIKNQKSDKIRVSPDLRMFIDCYDMRKKLQ